MAEITKAIEESIIDENEKILFDPYELLINTSSEDFKSALVKLAGYIYSSKGLYNHTFNDIAEVKNPAADHNEHIESYYSEHLNEIITANVNELVKEYPTADVQNDNIFASESVERYARRMDPKYIFLQSLARFTYAREITTIGEKNVTLFYDRTMVPLNHIFYMLSIINFCIKYNYSAYDALIVLLHCGIGYLKGNNDSGVNFRIRDLDFNSIHKSVLNPDFSLTAFYKMNEAYFNISDYTITLPKASWLVSNKTYSIKTGTFETWMDNRVKTVKIEKDELLLELDNLANILSFVYSKGFIELVKSLGNENLTAMSAGVILEDINDSTKLVCKLRNLLHSCVFNMKRLYGESIYIADARAGQSININNISEKESSINDTLFDEILETTEEMNSRIQAAKDAADAEAQRLAEEAEAERKRLEDEAIAAAQAEIERLAQEAIDAANALKDEAERKALEAQQEAERLQQQIAEAERLKQAAEAEKLRLEQEEAERKRLEEEEAARLAAEEAERLKLEAERQKALETEQRLKELEAQIEAERKKQEEEAERKRLEEERLKYEESERLKKALEEQQKATEEENARLKQELEQKKLEQEKKDAEEEKQKELEQKKKEEEEEREMEEQRKKEAEKNSEKDEDEEKQKKDTEKDSDGLGAGIIILIIILVISVIGAGAWIIMNQNRVVQRIPQMRRPIPQQTGMRNSAI